MSKIVYFGNVMISGMTSSAIEITQNINVTVKYSLISSCTSSMGAGIYILKGMLFIERTCIEKCSATEMGSAMRSYVDTTIKRSSVYQCAEKTAGKDDSIDIENSVTNLEELNCSRSITGESILQLYNTKQAKSSRCFFALGKGTYISQHHFIISPITHNNNVYTNNTLSHCFYGLYMQNTLTFENCVFSGNMTSIFFAGLGMSLPKIIFQNVAYLDSVSIGCSVSYISKIDSVPKFDVFQESRVCRQIEIELLTNRFQMAPKAIIYCQTICIQG